MSVPEPRVEPDPSFPCGPGAPSLTGSRCRLWFSGTAPREAPLCHRGRTSRDPCREGCWTKGVSLPLGGIGSPFLPVCFPPTLPPTPSCHHPSEGLWGLNHPLCQVPGMVQSPSYPFHTRRSTNRKGLLLVFCRWKDGGRDIR